MTDAELLQALAEEVRGMRDDMNEVARLIGVVRDEIGPIVENLSNSPMGKMILGAKR